MIDGTPFLKLYARKRGAELDRENAVEAQEQQLLKLVRCAANTRFGRDHDFATIRTVADFQARVPLRRYEDMWRDYWQPTFPRLTDCTWPGTISYFALSSGTTSGTTKYIPVSDDMNKSNSNGAKDMLVHHVRNRPHTKLLGGKNFMLGGSTDLTELAPGIYAGDLSGIVAARLRSRPARGNGAVPGVSVFGSPARQDKRIGPGRPLRSHEGSSQRHGLAKRCRRHAATNSGAVAQPST